MANALKASKAPSSSPPTATPTREAVDKARVMVLVEFVRKMSAELTESELAAFKHNIIDAFSNKPPAPRAGPVLGTVVALFQKERDKRSEWAVAEIKKGLDAAGIKAGPRALYNALGYLARKGRIKQIGYGRYYVIDYGFGIEGDPDLFSREGINA